MKKLKQITFLYFFICHSFILDAAIICEINISDVGKGEIYVEMTNVKFKNDSEYLIFPKVIPGMYEENNFGKYIYDVVAVLNAGTHSLNKSGIQGLTTWQNGKQYLYEHMFPHIFLLLQSFL